MSSVIEPLVDSESLLDTLFAPLCRLASGDKMLPTYCADTYIVSQVFYLFFTKTTKIWGKPPNKLCVLAEDIFDSVFELLVTRKPGRCLFCPSSPSFPYHLISHCFSLPSSPWPVCLCLCRSLSLSFTFTCRFCTSLSWSNIGKRRTSKNGLRPQNFSFYGPRTPRLGVT